MADKPSESALVQFLKCVPEPLRTRVKNDLSTVHRNKGQVLIQEDLPPTDVFFLREGLAEVVLYSVGGRAVCVHTVRVGDMFGEIAVLDRDPRSASVEALSEIVLDAMRGSDFLACLESSPAAGIWLARRLTLSLRRSTEKIFKLSVMSVASRLACELMRLAREGTRSDEGIEIENLGTHLAVAKRLGTERTQVTRALTSLKKDKIVWYDRSRFVILDPPRLKRACHR